MGTDPATVWTIGHSTRTFEQFLAVLAGYDIAAVADVRRFPGSRRYPHFGGDCLSSSLPEHGIAYQWFPDLGGRRKVQPGSPNTAWRNASFQGYADYTATTQFNDALTRMLALASRKRTVLMCAEVLWWRCHRALISDVLKLRGIEVVHIQDATHASVHAYTSPARVIEGRLSYAQSTSASP